MAEGHMGRVAVLHRVKLLMLQVFNIVSFTIVVNKQGLRVVEVTSSKCKLGLAIISFGGCFFINRCNVISASIPPSPRSPRTAKQGTGTAIVVKRLNQEGLQGHQEWLAESNYLGLLNHPNLVKLIGYCIDDDHRMLVYEFIPRGSLENHLFRRSSYFQPLSWNLRIKVALGAAKGLLTFTARMRKPTPISIQAIKRDRGRKRVIWSNYNAKLSDFGLAKDGPADGKSHVSTRVMGRYGYAAPEYMATGHLTARSDIYSFGVVLLENLTWRRCINKNRPTDEQILVEFAKPNLTNKRRILYIMYPRLAGQYSPNVAMRAAMLAGKEVGRWINI
ncbi:hypothetical protein QVD17_15420 [Tagetes erecta]|uniref:Protein kinase domain-containing protein n=1 Tax=Tagetes erecta TaxID=13708 RepID=A0AAD8KTB3_TARER|nr:hypothetical protein QVD17_15420 [Tagetes erecta]